MFFVVQSFVHSKKNRGQTLSGKGPLGSYSEFRVNDDPEISQLDAEYDPELGQSEPIIGQVCRKLTKYLGHHWPRMEYDPNGTFNFPGNFDCF